MNMHRNMQALKEVGYQHMWRPRSRARAQGSPQYAPSLGVRVRLYPSHDSSGDGREWSERVITFRSVETGKGLLAASCRSR